MLKKLACLLALIVFPLFGQMTPQAQPLTSAACKLDGTVGCGSGDVASVAVATTSPLTGGATCTSGACSFTLGLGVVGAALGGNGADFSGCSGALLFAAGTATCTATLGSGSFTRSAGTLAVASGKTATVNNTVTLSGTDGVTVTLPTESRYLGRIATQVTDVTVANTTAETSITTGTIVGTRVISANTAFVGEHYRWAIGGRFSTTGTPTLGMTIKLGSVALFAPPALATISGASNSGFTLTADCTVRSIGASGTVTCSGVVRTVGDASSQANSAANTGVATVDFTVDQTPQATITWGTASASNTFTCVIFAFERL